MSFDLANSAAPLLSRQAYRSCRIRVAGESFAAICVDRRYYSFFRVVDESIASKLIDRLLQRGDRVVLTQTPKGYAIWVLEPEAQPLRRPTSFPVLTSTAQYRLCQIRVPDLDQNLSAIEFKNCYYSLFRWVQDLEQALPIINKLNDRGDQFVITKTQTGYSLWILEVDAWAVRT